MDDEDLQDFKGDTPCVPCFLMQLFVVVGATLGFIRMVDKL